MIDEQDDNVCGMQTHSHLIPGGECVACQVFRCAHCLRIVTWDFGSSVGPDETISEDEADFLEDCCDDCWCAVTTPLYAAHARLGQEVAP